MENLQDTTDPQEQPQLVVSEEMRSYFYEMAKWANFLAIVGFVFAGFMVVGAFTLGSAMGTNPELGAMVGQMGAFGGLAFTIILLLYAFVIFYPSLLLFKYATKAKLGVLYGEQASLDEAMAKLKSLFKFWGIITMIFIILYILMVVFSAMAQVAVK